MNRRQDPKDDFEGRLLAVADDGVEVEIRERRNPSSVHVAFADVLAGRLAVEI